ncbi:hypothetical protein [Hyphomonas jannaschiana]|uniref:Uncharacterized protein n=1 Tax=Hyphomonas jannaschiana VP2 TaxID=1280952 RepID=A0A059F6K8_9PROT|nr:hypothetical protein [Hyphomonas jannaschiana]KCZ82811.1 hypothetical protein HJA_17480 [Hyphomonas jannaschiana VP2]
MLLRSAACVLAVCGIWLLQVAWRRRAGNGRHLAFGWVALFLSVILWAATSHPDKGTALGIVAIMLAALGALAWIYVQAEQKPARDPADRRARVARAGVPEILKRIAAGILLGPLAGLAALAIATAGFVALQKAGLEHTGNLVIAMFAFPLLWSALAVVAGANSRLWRKSAIVIGAGLAPLAYLGLAAQG